MDFAEFTFFYDVREIRARRFPLTSWCQGDVAQSLDAEVFGEDQQPYVDVVLESSEGGLLARHKVRRVNEDANQDQKLYRCADDPPGQGPVHARKRRQPEAHHIKDPENRVVRVVVHDSGERADHRVQGRDGKGRHDDPSDLGAVPARPLLASPRLAARVVGRFGIHLLLLPSFGIVYVVSISLRPLVRPQSAPPTPGS
jgi:hypothetical protein